MKLRHWIWFFLGLLVLLIRGLAASFPDQTDLIYSRGLFPFIRITFDYTLGKLPFPSFFLFWDWSFFSFFFSFGVIYCEKATVHVWHFRFDPCSILPEAWSFSL
jgi:hypothetical protein